MNRYEIEAKVEVVQRFVVEAPTKEDAKSVLMRGWSFEQIHCTEFEPIKKEIVSIKQK